MLVTCWSAKGGVGTTVVCSLMALRRARSHPDGVLAVDLGGDLPTALGIGSGPGTGGVRDWLAAGEAPVDALGRLAVDAAPGLHVLCRGSGGPVDRSRIDLLVAQLAETPRLVLVDAGALVVGDPVDPLVELARALAASATRSLLVTRPCYLAIQRSRDLPLQPSGVVLVSESGRALRARDVEEALGIPVVLEIGVDPSIARAVDSGILTARVPRGVCRAIDRLAA